MTAPSGAVPPDHTILRLPKPPKDFVPDGYRPSSQEFLPSSADKEDAELNHHPVRISVWDEAFTTVEQARTLRNGPSIVLRGTVGDVLAAGASAVVYEPLPSPDRDRPGADGHAGIEGIPRREADDTRTAETRVEHRDRLAAIAACFRLDV